MKLFGKAFDVIKQHEQAYVLANLVFYGPLLAAMAYGALFPQVRIAATERMLALLESNEPMRAALDAYSGGNVLTAAALTFAINLVFAAFLTTTLPSLVVPFLGIGLSAWRAIEIGLTLAPVGAAEALHQVPHYLTLVVESQAYVIVTLGVWVHGRMFLQPRLYALPSRRAGYVAGLAATGRLYVLAATILLLVAVYEAFEVIFLVA